MTAETLQKYSLKDLGQLAKKRGVSGWHRMRKDQLVKALARKAAARAAVPSAKSPSAKKAAARKTAARKTAARKTAARKSASRKPASRKPVARKAARRPVPAKKTPPTRRAVAGSKLTVSAKSRHSATRPPVAAKPAKAKTRKSRKVKDRVALERMRRDRTQLEQLKDLAAPTTARPNTFHRDRLVAMVRGPFWLQAYWELTRQGVERAQAAMGQEWHTAKPVLRLMEVGDGTSGGTETLVRNIVIHGGVNNWYVDVTDPPRNFRLEIGYLAASGRFFQLSRSNIVSTPQAGASDAIDENWTEVAENFDKIYAMSGGNAETGSSIELQELFEERLRRPMGPPVGARIVAGMNGFGKRRDLKFEVDAELLVFGSADPDAHVTLQGDPVKLRPDGTFTVRFALPNCRQVIPAVACSADGVEQRTIVLAVERNTKAMEPLLRDGNE